ncbi:MAG: response regulator [Verrucomicrobia bacterium]|nr:response regulator [Verrucomicrobiota bacterium]
MTKPLAICLSENLLLVNQLVNRLQEMGYRVEVTHEGKNLVPLAIRERPFLVLMDLGYRTTDVCQLIASVRQDAQTSHIPILAFGPQRDGELQTAAHKAGANLVAVESGLLQQLPELLNQVLEIE